MGPLHAMHPRTWRLVVIGALALLVLAMAAVAHVLERRTSAVALTPASPAARLLFHRS